MNNKLRNYCIIFLLQLLLIITGCKKDKEDIIVPEPEPATVIDAFECGSIGEVEQISDTEWELSIADDNDNPGNPDSWRSWWYVKMENLTTSLTTKITIKNSGWKYYYVPVYSYDQKEWYRFEDKEVTQNSSQEIVIRKQFMKPEVWIAMFYPYSFTDLENYIHQIQDNANINISTPGETQQGKPIYLFTITKPGIEVTSKKRVIIHARTHPAETPASFVLEGMINYLISGNAEADNLLSSIEFHVFPMQNVDGVVAGNYRSTPKSENLEVMWYFDSNNPLDLSSDVPPEISTIHQYAKMLMNDDGPPVSIALNLHSSNSEPDIRPFFFPHFGSEIQGYSPVEASLWNNQINFIGYLASHHGYNMIEPVVQEGGSSFVSKKYPESWWWANYKDQVMAITMEMTYGHAGYSPRWVTPDDLRDLGRSLALAIGDYCNASMPSTPERMQPDYLNTMQNPHKYPALNEEEVKR